MKALANYITIFLLYFSCSLFAQNQYDYQWQLGYGNPPIGGVTLIDFQTEPPMMHYKAEKTILFVAHSSICDAEGNFQFYSDGCSIINHQYNRLALDGYLSPGVVQAGFCDDLGSPYGQSLITLPLPGSSSIYYLFHLNSSIVVLPTGQWFRAQTELNYTLIDMSKNNHTGAVVESQVTILQDTLASGYLQAVKHANGVYWWILAPEHINNCYYKLLLTPEGVINYDKQCLGIGTSDPFDHSGQAVFSPDGTKYARFHTRHGLQVFDFDRCSGHLSNAINLELSDETATSGVAISPNSRYLYACFTKEVYQFDLAAENMAASKILIAEWDGFVDYNPTNFSFMQLAPNGKIYIAGNGINIHLHVINQPNQAGLACDLVQHGIELPSLIFANLPNFPNFRLGESDEPCDFMLATSIAHTKTEDVKIYPNPASHMMYVELPEAEAVSFTLLDAFGRVVLAQDFTNEKLLAIYVSSLASGFYFYQIVGADWKKSGKIVIEGRR